MADATQQGEAGGIRSVESEDADRLSSRADTHADPAKRARHSRRARMFRGFAYVPEGPAPARVLRRDTVFRRALGAADVVSASLAVVVAVVVLGDDALTLLAIAAAPIIVLVGKLLGLYDRDQHLLNKATLDEVPELVKAASLYTLVIWLGEGALIVGFLGKLQVLTLWVFLFLAMTSGRVLARQLASRSTTPERCLVIGDAEAAAWLGKKLETISARAGVVGRVSILSDDEGEATTGPPSFGEVAQLGEVLVSQDIDRAVIAPGGADSETILAIIRMVRSLGVRVSVLPRLFEVVGSTVEFDDIHGTTLLGLRREGLTWSSFLLKRASDVVGASLVLLVLAPVLVAIAAGIKLTSPGPVLFRQRRIGWNDQEFTMLKFRTMVSQADGQKAKLEDLNEADGLFKIERDPRITRFGRFMRQTSLDELPQLVNVLRGEMSLVGPRPLIPEEDERVEGWQRRRLHVYPGMTGLWQIFGSSRIPLHEMVKIDYLYGANWSLWLDTKILLRTLPYVLSRRGL